MKRPRPKAFKRVAAERGIWVQLLDGPREVGGPFQRTDLIYGHEVLRLDGWPDSQWYTLERIGPTGIHYYRFMGSKDATGLAG